MSDDSPESLGDDPTYVGKGKEREAQSLGDQSTYAGSNESSLSDLDGLGGSLEDGLDGLEIVDLESRYTIIRPIGKGGMGEVFLATDTRLNRKVAIKRIKDELTTPAAAARFLTEAKSIAALSHPYIVQVYDYGRAKDGPFLIMEYVEGENLHQVCNQGVMVLEDAVDLACKLCDALSKAHGLGIIHRDIKPANILMTEEGWPKISDFGLAKSTSDRGHTMTGTALGTLDFMPPEQRRDASAVDERSDLWSLAATIYQMVTGEPPKVIDLEEVPPVLRTALGKALKTQPDKRYQNVKSFRDDIEQCNSSDALPIGQLNIGECPNCNTRNESNRRFCRECAASLVVDCLGCGESIAVWDKICGECGANQREVSKMLERELISLISQARTCSENGQYESAIDLAEGVLVKSRGRFESAENWAKEFIESNRRFHKSVEVQTYALFLDAQTHRRSHDYQSAIRVLDGIPPNLRTPQMLSFLDQLRADFNEFRFLVTEINYQINTRQLDDLDDVISKVDRAVELGGEERSKKKGLLSLKKSLERRRQRKVDRDRIGGGRVGQDSDAELLAFLTNSNSPQKFDNRITNDPYAAQKVNDATYVLIASNALGLLVNLPMSIAIGIQEGGPSSLIFGLLVVCVCPLISIWGLIEMRRLRSYEFAIVSCVISMLPLGGCCFIGFPYGIWALNILSEQRIKDAFS
ncbi:serine/threonine-protein kinase [bacterium]|nr:serine/threonine-protein kinase [bacterium]